MVKIVFRLYRKISGEGCVPLCRKISGEGYVPAM